MDLVLRGTKPQPWVGYWMCPNCQSVYRISNRDVVDKVVEYIATDGQAPIIRAPQCRVCDRAPVDLHRNTLPLPSSVTGIPDPVPIPAPTPTLTEAEMIELAAARQDRITSTEPTT